MQITIDTDIDKATQQADHAEQSQQTRPNPVSHGKQAVFAAQTIQ